MEINHIQKAIIFFSLSILGYIHHKWWINNKLKKGIKLGAYDKTYRKISDWGFIIFCGILAILNFVDYILKLLAD